MIGPREDIISWDDYFMAIAVLGSLRSRDPNTQVGACIVDDFNHIVGTGFNGLPRGCNPHDFPWDRKGDFLNTKYAYTCHAEENAIDNSDQTRVRGSKMYVTLFPCNNCAKRIIQNGIKQIIYLSDKYHDSDESVASRKLLDAAKIETKKFQCINKEILINLVNKDV